MNGDQLKKIRKSSGQTRAQFGEVYGVSEHTVAKWEQGVHDIPPSVARLILSELPLQLSLGEITKIGRMAEAQGVSIDSWLANAIRAGLKLWLLGWFLSAMFERTRCESWPDAVIAGGSDMLGVSYAVAAFTVRSAIQLVAAIVG